MKVKSGVGMTLIVLFVITLVTGIILHLKKHGVVVEPRDVIKLIHWLAGFTMGVLACLHGKHFWRVFINTLKKRAPTSINTVVLSIFIIATVVTGVVKLASPVKIQGLGLWHYWLGIIMSVSVLFHLFRGVPMLVKMMNTGRKVNS